MKLSTLSERIITYCKNNGGDIPKEKVEKVAQHYKYTLPQIRSAFRELENVAHIGQWYDAQTKKSYIRWYEPNDLTNHVQECLDRGDDW
jgi:hypothetical protein